MNYKRTLILALMALLTTAVSTQEISFSFPYESHYQQIDDHNLHYVDVGSGDTFLFLHGIPMSAYSWRNVIPHLSESARCVAIDFMGFGKSDKPDIDYTFDDQYRFLSAFIDSLKLKNVTLVMTDIGGIVGQKYASLHPENIKAMVFMETSITDAETFHKNAGMMQKMMFWMAGKKKMGYRMFVKKNMFVKLMPMLIKRKLSTEEKENYRAPFTTEQSRKAMYTLAHSFPKKGKNATDGDMADYLNKNAAWLISSSHPKLLLTAKPGMLINKKNIKWAKENLEELQVLELGKAKHLMEEDLPHEIGTSIRNWHASQK